MAKKSVLERNARRLRLIETYAEKRKQLKDQIYDRSISLKDRILLVQKLDSLPRDSSTTRFRVRCMLTGRGRGIINGRLGISRMVLRRMAASGQIPGLRKASW